MTLLQPAKIFNLEMLDYTVSCPSSQVENAYGKGSLHS